MEKPWPQCRIHSSYANEIINLVIATKMCNFIHAKNVCLNVNITPFGMQRLKDKFFDNGHVHNFELSLNCNGNTFGC